MHKARAFFFVSARLLGLALLLVSTNAHSNPAQQVTKTFEQPDGSALRLQLWGDEFANGWETEDGRTVLLNRTTNFWEYAVRDANGVLEGSGLRVGRDSPVGEPHLRPAGAALEAAYAANGISRPGVLRLQSRPAWASGTVHVLVIMVQFPADPADPNGSQPAVPATFSAAQMQANLFGATPTGPGNLTNYFSAVSYGALNLLGTVVGPFTVANDKNDYDDGPLTAQNLVSEAIALADPSVDFSAYDNDHDGVVDGVFVCYAGGGADDGVYLGANPNTNNLWPHMSWVTPIAVDGGARTVQPYVLCPEILWYTPSPLVRTIGVYAHEFGHVLGLPDLYDTDGSSEGVGHWCLMGSGSWTSNSPGTENGESPAHLSAWCKSWLNWVTPTDLSGACLDESIPQAETNALAVRLLENPGGPNDWPGGTGEYFLIENRQRTGFDQGLDGCGLLVWHVDESRTSNAAEGHTSSTHRLVDLEEADGPPENLEASPRNRGDAGDPYPGASNNRLWSDTTTPNSLLYSGAATGIRMAVPSTSCGSTMSARFEDLTGSPVCSVAPYSLAFSVGAIGGSQSKTFAITNSGCGTLNGSATSPRTEFSIAPDSYSLAAGASALLTVTYTPSNYGDDECYIGTGCNTSVYCRAVGPTEPESCASVPLCTAIGNQALPTITSDGAGGAIVTWHDYRSGVWDIYAQHISANGTVQWTANGVPLCTLIGDQLEPSIVSDGAGGAIVTWNNYSNEDGSFTPSAQRISATGNVLWAADGVAVCPANGGPSYMAVTPDGAGGAIIAWATFRTGDYGPGFDIYAQHISANGTVQWTANGVPLCTAIGDQLEPSIVSDGAGGGIVTWRSGDSGIYAQRVSADGSVQWASDGVALCTAARQRWTPSLTSDGAGGAIVTWEDDRSEVWGDIYVQRISAAGTVQWTTNGVALCTAGGRQWTPRLAPDGAGGAIVAWLDQRSGAWDIYAQRISASGAVQWTPNGVPLCAAIGDQIEPSIVSDGEGGAIVTWQDQRSDNNDIYAQRISAGGTPKWAANGAAVEIAAGSQMAPVVALDGLGGAFVAWMGDHGDENYDIYARRLNEDGLACGTWVTAVPSRTELPATLVLDPVTPNPSRGGTLTVHFSLPSGAPARLELLDVAGRRIASHEVGAGEHTLDLGAGQHLAPGLYLVRLTQGATTRTTRVAVLR